MGLIFIYVQGASFIEKSFLSFINVFQSYKDPKFCDHFEDYYKLFLVYFNTKKIARVSPGLKKPAKKLRGGPKKQKILLTHCFYQKP